MSPSGVGSSWAEVDKQAARRPGYMVRVAICCCSANEVGGSPRGVLCSWIGPLLVDWFFARGLVLYSWTGPLLRVFGVNTSSSS